MKRLIIIFCLLFGVLVTVQAQEEMSEEPAQTEEPAKSKKELKKEKKAAKKAARKQAQTEAMIKSNAMVVGQAWVLEATTLQGRQGQMYNLDPTINFVIVDGENGSIQLGFNGIVGWNGVGGVTLDGRIISYEVKEPKKEGQGAKVTARFQGPGVNATLQLTAAGEFGDVVLNGTFSNTRLTFRGKLVHPSESRVYKGMRSN